MNYLIIHGFEGTKDSNWFPWLTELLSSQGHEVVNVSFPNSDHPDMDEILKFYRPLVRDVDVIIGHSVGPLIALKLAEKTPVKKIVMVAPTLGPLDYKELEVLWPDSDIEALRTIISTPYDLNEVQADEKIAIFSENDPYIPVQFSRYLDSSWKVLILKDQGHFQVNTFPEILELL